MYFYIAATQPQEFQIAGQRLIEFMARLLKMGRKVERRAHD